jgi:hypothetical protein
VVRLGCTGRRIGDSVGTVLIGLAVWLDLWCCSGCVVGLHPVAETVCLSVEERDATATGMETDSVYRRWYWCWCCRIVQLVDWHRKNWLDGHSVGPGGGRYGRERWSHPRRWSGLQRLWNKFG